MVKKILAVLLAMLMVACIVPFSASADEEVIDAQARVDGWNANNTLIIEKLIDNESSANWKYVAENNKEITDTMITYTVFALYDDAWKNGFDKSVSIDDAEAILCSIIEKVDANFGDSKVQEIINVLETASDVNDFLQKVNGIIKISDTLESEEWTKTFKYINYAIEAGKLYEEQREEVIKAYAQVLSVQAANEYYKSFLSYIAENTTYDVLAKAAENLIVEIEESVESILKKEVANRLNFTASKVLTEAAEIALNSNAYTAVALKVYDIGTSVADVLWNTSDQYVLMDELYTTFFVETAAQEYITVAAATGEPEYYEFAINNLLSIRQVGVQTLYDLKSAQNEGVIGKIKNQINYNISFDIIQELAFLQLAKHVLFDVDVNDYVPVNSIVSANTNAYVSTDDVALSNSKGIVDGDSGYYSVYFNEGTSTYIKTLFISDDTDVQFRYGSDCYATATIDKMGDYLPYDYSFTSVVVPVNGYVSINTAAPSVYSVTDAEGVTTTANMNDDFVFPAYNEVTLNTVTTAVKEVAVSEARGKILEISSIINNIIEAIKTFFSTLFAAK